MKSIRSAPPTDPSLTKSPVISEDRQFKSEHAGRTFYFCSPSYKATFDKEPHTIYGDYEAIEERSSAEVWPEAPREPTIRKPAFDVTRRDYIHGIVCEEGNISPHSILEAVRRRYPWILKYAGS